MKIDTIYMKNFKQYRECSIDFPDGLIGFIGFNGAGKSTIFEAVLYALFGETGMTKENIRNSHIPDNASDPVEVKLQFSDKGKEYRLERSMRGKSLTAKAVLYIDDMHAADGAKEVNKEVKKILKMDGKSFAASFFSKQKDVTALLETGDKDRAALLRKLLGLEKLDTIEKLVGEKTKEALSAAKAIADSKLSPEEIEKTEQEIASADTVIKEKNDILKDHKEEQQQNKEKLRKANKILDEYREVEKKHLGYEKDISAREKEIESTGAKIRAKQEELAVLEKEEKDLPALQKESELYIKVSDEVSALEKVRALYVKKEQLQSELGKTEQRKIDAEEKIKELESEMTAKGDAGNILAGLQTEKEKVKQEKSAKNEIRETLRSEHTSFKNNLKEIEAKKEKIEKLGKDAPCPECERPLAEHYDFLLGEYANKTKEISARLAAIEADGKKVKEELNRLEENEQTLDTKIKSAERAINIISELAKQAAEQRKYIVKTEEDISKLRRDIETIGEVSFDEETLEAKVKEKQRLDKQNTIYIEMRERVKTIPGRKKEIGGLEQDAAAARTALESLHKELNELNYNPEELKRRSAVVEMAEEEREKLAEAVNLLVKEISGWEANKKVLNEKLLNNERLAAQIAEKEKEAALYGKLKAIVNDFKGKVTSRELPAISRQASALFTEITKGRYTDMVITDEFKLEVNHDGMVRPLHTLSGGEKDLASLCLRIAISKRVSSLAGREKMGFLALDEVFGSQDEGRREGLINALNIISRDFNQIFVVSHNLDVQEKFDKQLQIKKEGLYSTASMLSSKAV